MLNAVGEVGVGVFGFNRDVPDMAWTSTTLRLSETANPEGNTSPGASRRMACSKVAPEDRPKYPAPFVALGSAPFVIVDVVPIPSRPPTEGAARGF
jgi:hypothetical protein